VQQSPWQQQQQQQPGQQQCPPQYEEYPDIVHRPLASPIQQQPSLSQQQQQQQQMLSQDQLSQGSAGYGLQGLVSHQGSQQLQQYVLSQELLSQGSAGLPQGPLGLPNLQGSQQQQQLGSQVLWQQEQLQPQPFGNLTQQSPQQQPYQQQQQGAPGVHQGWQQQANTQQHYPPNWSSPAPAAAAAVSASQLYVQSPPPAAAAARCQQHTNQQQVQHTDYPEPRSPLQQQQLNHTGPALNSSSPAVQPRGLSTPAAAAVAAAAAAAAADVVRVMPGPEPNLTALKTRGYDQRFVDVIKQLPWSTTKRSWNKEIQVTTVLEGEGWQQQQQQQQSWSLMDLQRCLPEPAVCATQLMLPETVTALMGWLSKLFCCVVLLPRLCCCPCSPPVACLPVLPVWTLLCCCLLSQVWTVLTTALDEAVAHLTRNGFHVDVPQQQDQAAAGGGRGVQPGRALP
jgi:hypothetical protein